MTFDEEKNIFKKKKHFIDARFPQGGGTSNR